MKVRENIAGSLVLAILTILVLLPLVTVLLQVICPGPVSYTHLDVYKRQSLSREDILKLLGE